MIKFIMCSMLICALAGCKTEPLPTTGREFEYVRGKHESKVSQEFDYVRGKYRKAK
jgi:hypothetical protein